MKKTFADMVRSLGLMAVIIGVLLFLGARYLVHPTAADRMPAADYTGIATGFAEVAHAPALVPPVTALPTSWRANAARLVEPRPDVHQLHIGWAVPGEHYAGLDEATGSPDGVIGDVLGRGGLAVTGTVDLNGERWQRRTSDRGETALTRTVDKVTIVVTGNASDADLQRLAESLQ